MEPCDQQNGAITGYSVRCGEVGTSERERRVEMASGDSMTTVSGLTKETVYTVEVAAETSCGTGVYSEPLTIESPDSEWVFPVRKVCVFSSSTDVYLTLNGEVIPNQGYVEISYIGSADSTALLCHTNRPANGAYSSEGNWLAPDGSSTDVQGFEIERAPMVIGLKKSVSNVAPNQGIYQCLIADAALLPKAVYVGIYNTGGGKAR